MKKCRGLPRKKPTRWVRNARLAFPESSRGISPQSVRLVSSSDAKQRRRSLSSSSSCFSSYLRGNFRRRSFRREAGQIKINSYLSEDRSFITIAGASFCGGNKGFRSVRVKILIAARFETIEHGPREPLNAQTRNSTGWPSRSERRGMPVLNFGSGMAFAGERPRNKGSVIGRSPRTRNFLFHPHRTGAGVGAPSCC